MGQGLANVAVAFVGGYPVCASLSGTSVNLAGGARGPGPIYVFTALALLVALSLGPLFAYLPRFALAAVVIMAVASLLDVRRFLALCRADRLDALVVLTTFGVTLGRPSAASRQESPRPGWPTFEDAARAGARAPEEPGRVRAQRACLPGAAPLQLLALPERRGDPRRSASPSRASCP